MLPQQFALYGVSPAQREHLLQAAQNERTNERTMVAEVKRDKRGRITLKAIKDGHGSSLLLRLLQVASGVALILRCSLSCMLVEG